MICLLKVIIIMSNYISIITSHQDSTGNRISASEIYTDLMSKSVWGLHPRTAARAKIVPGDKIVFYLGGENQHFVGTATATSSAYRESDTSHNYFSSEDMFRLDLADILIFDRPKPIKPLLNNLSFIKNPYSWGPYLQGGIRKINSADFERIVTSENYDVDTVLETERLKHFVTSVDLSTVSFSPHALSSPDRIDVARIIENLDTRWAIPNFQRYFDWNRESVRSLLESIFNDYYVGAFLLWESDEQAPLELIAIQGSSNSLSRTDFIILDGQQRCTALYYAIKSPDFPLKGTSKNSYYYIDFKNFILEQNSERIITVKDRELSNIETYESLLFPINKLSNSFEWLDGLEDYLHTTEADLPYEKLRDLKRLIESRVRHMWQGFQIPFVVLPSSMDLAQVSVIFEKINTEGKPLGTFDLLIAKLLRNGINLRNLWESVLENYEGINNYCKSEKTKMFIFQCLSLIHHPSSSAKKKDLLSLYENLSLSSAEEFITLWNQVVENLESTFNLLENLRTGYGVLNDKEVPFSPMIPVLTALNMEAATRADRLLCQSKIDQWYWSAIFTNAYSSSAETQMTSDYKEVMNWFNGEENIPKVVTQARNDLSNLDLKEVNNHSNAIYKGVMSLIALAGAVDFETGHALEMARSNDKDHIFPKSNSAGFSQHPYINSVLNMTWLSKETNMRKRDKVPSVYINEFLTDKYSSNEQALTEVLESHTISAVGLALLQSDNFDGFLEEREKSIIRVIRSKIGLSPDTEEVLETAPETAVDELELNLRDFIDSHLSKAFGADYWDAKVSNGVKQRVEQKLEQRFKRHPAERSQPISARNRFDYCDIMDYQETISVNWDIFESVFGSRGEVEKHFLQLKEYRNAVKHGRVMNNVERKQGEASYEWLISILS